MQLVQADKRNLIERSDTFLYHKNKKIASQAPTGMNECTFKPQIIPQHKKTSQSPLKNEQNNEETRDVVQRLYAYLDYFEKRKDECKKILNNNDV